MADAKRALVTGIDSSVIARAICSYFLKEGYTVIATCEDKYAPGMEARLEFEDEHRGVGSVEFIPVDFTIEDSIENLVQTVSASPLNVIVNCAATLAFHPDGDLRNESSAFDFSEFNRVISYNVTAVAAICLQLKNNLVSGGSIINVTSSAAQEGAFATISYNASKAAVDNLTKTLANFLGPAKGVRVNSIAPGWIPPSKDVAAGGTVALANALTPSLNIGEPRHVVAAVKYLLDNEFQNGSIIPVDGGLTSSYLPYMLEALDLNGVSMDETLATVTSNIESAKKEMS